MSPWDPIGFSVQICGGDFMFLLLPNPHKLSEFIFEGIASRTASVGDGSEGIRGIPRTVICTEIKNTFDQQIHL